MILVKARRSDTQFWRDTCVALGQVNYGVFAALWFVPPYDQLKTAVLLVNAMLTLVFTIIGRRLAHRL